VAAFSSSDERYLYTGD